MLCQSNNMYLNVTQWPSQLKKKCAHQSNVSDQIRAQHIVFRKDTAVGLKVLC